MPDPILATHPRMARQTVKVNSVQVGFGPKGAFADIDLFNRQGNLKKTCQGSGKNDDDIVTPHFYLAKVLGNCK
jgi:hypothetical protein